MARTKHVQQVFWNNDRKMPKAATVPSLEDMWIALEEDRNAKKASQREKTRKLRRAKKVLPLYLYNVLLQELYLQRSQFELLKNPYVLYYGAPQRSV